MLDEALRGGGSLDLAGRFATPAFVAILLDVRWNE
jgi:hypothetical protein